MRNNLFNYKDVRNKPHRSGFDLSKRLLFTSKVGELLPVYCKPTMPGDHFSINVQSFTRTQTVQSSAFTRIKEYVDFFYIPYHLLWRNFQSSFTQIQQSSQFADSPLKDVPISEKLPYINQRQLFIYIKDSYASGLLNGDNKFDEVGASRIEQIFKLLAYLGYQDFTALSVDTLSANWSKYLDVVPNINVSLMPLLAYQKVYYDFYRNDQWEVNRPTSFNVDYMVDSTNYADFVNSGDDVINSGILNMHYANYAKDLFLGLLPSAQYGDTSVISSSISGNGYIPANTNIGKQTNIIQNEYGFGSNVNITTWSTTPALQSSTGDTIYPFGVRSSDGGSAGIAVTTDTIQTPTNVAVNLSNLTSQIDVLKLRQAQALQKWKEITQCGDYNYRAQIEKHFGVKLPELMAHRCQYIGGTQGVITINEVVNQNLEGANEASIKGKGVGSFNDNNITFDAKDHGLIMGIYYAIPYVDYALSGTSRDLSTVNISDLPIPEFDRLGFEPVSINEFFNVPASSQALFVGYAPRYHNYKTDLDEVKGAFRSTLPNWVAQYDSNYIKSLTTTKQNFLPCLKVNASILDDIFAVNAWNGNFVTPQIDNDQLLNCINFEVHAVRNLDYSGVPY